MKWILVLRKYHLIVFVLTDINLFMLTLWYCNRGSPEPILQIITIKQIFRKGLHFDKTLFFLLQKLL